MKRTLTLVLVALGVLLGASTAVRAAATPVFMNADNEKQVRPRSLYLTGDGTLDVLKVSWRSWGATQAIGTGVADYHGCTPSCAAGKPHQLQVIVRLGSPVTCHGRRYFNRVQLFNRRTTKPFFTSFLAHQNWAPCRL
jgi:hypothetical protein